MSALAMDRTDWMAQAPCFGAPFDWFFPEDENGDEPPYPDPRAKALCERCPFRTPCLAKAIADDAVGTWGGTTRYQRSVLSRPKERRGCPACGSRFSVTRRGKQYCLACATSWFSVRPDRGAS